MSAWGVMSVRYSALGVAGAGSVMRQLQALAEPGDNPAFSEPSGTGDITGN
jgi:hypothetical protein